MEFIGGILFGVIPKMEKIDVLASELAVDFLWHKFVNVLALVQMVLWQGSLRLARLIAFTSSST